MRREHLIGEDLAGGRLDRVLGELEPEFSRRSVRRAIEEGRVFVDGRRTKVASRTLVLGARLLWYPEELEDAPSPEIPILHEDEDLVIVNKPPGLHVNETETTARASVESVLAKTRREIFVVHRLDLETSGVMVLAKRIEVARVLTRAFAERTVKKEYLAITERPVPEGFVDLPIGPDPRSPRTRRVLQNGKAARSWFCTLGQSGTAHLILGRPETGRTHQLRVHLAELGAPIVGDRAYGGVMALRLEGRIHEVSRACLHAWRLMLPGLVGGRRWDAALPQDFQPFTETDLAVWSEAR